MAVSQYLLQKSHKVVLVARTESELEALKKQYPSQVEYLAADLTNFEVSNTGRTNDNGMCINEYIFPTATERY